VAAFSLLEVVFVLGVAATLGSIAVPQAMVSLDDLRTAGAARYMSGRLQRSRMEAVKRNASTALKISRVGDTFAFSTYVDGNGNGVLARDIQTGADQAIAAPERLGYQFPGVEFGAISGLPAVDATGAPPGSDPIRLGSSDMAVFTALGTATTGSLYMRGRRNAQYVVRIYGETGKTRVLKFNARSGQWIPLSGT
jgi:type II secretory pathway pseudopilin PulG